MFPIVLICVAVVVALLLILVATRPAAFRITRSATIAAPPAVVHAQVADFRAWRAWSPWEGMDPNLQRTYGDVPSGVGATYHWVGNKKVGEGKMRVTESRPGEHLAIELVFIKPFAATNQAVFTFAPSGGGTAVTWTMTGTNNFMGKAFCLLMDMDKMVGGQFAQGLTSLKAVCEKKSA